MAIRETDTLAVVVYKAAFPIQIGVRMTADAIFLFEEGIPSKNL